LIGLPFYFKILPSHLPLPHPPDPIPIPIFFPSFDDAAFAQTEAHFARLAEEERLSLEHLRRHGTPNTHPRSAPFGYPSALLILSCLMWSMSFIGMMLWYIGFDWTSFASSAYFALLKWPYTVPLLWFRHPPDKPAFTLRDRKKKLLLLALLVALRKVQSLAHIAPASETSLHRRVRRATKGHGPSAKLMLTKLQAVDQTSVLNALKSLPDTLFDSGDLKSSIIDTGASYHATGFLDDFVPGTLSDLPTPMKLDGIAGSLEATKQGLIRHVVLSDSGTEETLEMQAVYMPRVETRLISPQLYLRQLEASGASLAEYVVRAGSSFLRLPNKHVITLGYDSLKIFPC
jgi:hypothetical protein